MRRLLFLLALTPMACQTTPGFQCGWSFMIPPSINSTAPLHPMPSAPQMSYAVEAPCATPVVQRYYGVTPPPIAVQAYDTPPYGPPAQIRQRQAAPEPIKTMPACDR